MCRPGAPAASTWWTRSTPIAVPTARRSSRSVAASRRCRISGGTGTPLISSRRRRRLGSVSGTMPGSRGMVTPAARAAARYRVYELTSKKTWVIAYSAPAPSLASSAWMSSPASAPSAHWQVPYRQADDGAEAGDDIQALLAKEGAGAEYAITQVFFEVSSYTRYLAAARAAGV